MDIPRSVPVALLLLASLPPVRAPQADVFVIDPELGDDALGDGSPGSPWQTVVQGLAQAVAGDSLVLRGGAYDTINQGGPSGLLNWSPGASDVSIVAFPGETPVIDYSGVSPTSSDHGVRLDEADDGTVLDGLVFSGWQHGFEFRAEPLVLLGADQVTVRRCTWDACDGNFSAVRVKNAWDGSQDILVEDCEFVNATNRRHPSVHMAGDGDDARDERFTLRGCRFNSDAALALEEGGRPGVVAVGVDSLVIEACEAINAGGLRDDDPTNGSDFLYFLRCTRVRVEATTFRRYIGDWERTGPDHPLHNSDGVLLANACRDVIIRDCGFWGAGHGVQVVWNTTDVRLERVYTDSTYDDGIFFDSSTSGGVVMGCVIHHAWDNGMDLKGRDLLVQHNTIVRTYSHPIMAFETSQNVVILDNVVSDLIDLGDVGLVLEGSVGGGPEDVSWDHDLYWSPDPGERYFEVCDEQGCDELDWDGWRFDEGNDWNGVLGDPRFVDPQGRAWPPGSQDFGLLPGSPGRDAASDGTDIGAIQSELLAVTEPAPAGPAGVRAVSPFRSGTTLWVDSRTDGDRTGVGVVRILDVGGRLVRSLRLGASVSRTRWDGRDRSGRDVPPGVYLLYVERGARQLVGRVVRIP